MTLPWRVALALSLAFITSPGARAESPPRLEGPVDLATLMEYAERHSPLVKSLEEMVNASKSRVMAARGPWWPRLEASFSHAQVEPIANGEGIDETWWSVTARQRILDFGKTGSVIESLKSKERIAELEKLRVLRLLKLEVARRYFDYLLALEAVDVYMQTNAIAYVHWDRDREKHGVGLVSKRQVSEKEVIYRREKLNLTRAERTAALRLNSLQEAIGAPLGEYFEVEPPPEKPPEIDLPELGAIENQAVSERPELAMYEERIAALQASLDGVRADYFPTLDGVAEVGDSSRELLSKNRWKVGVEASVSLFEGFARNAKKDELEARVRALRFDRDNLERKIKMEVKNSYAELELAGPKLALAEARMKNAQDELDYARSEYELNLVTELGDAFAEYAKAKLSLMTTQYNLRLVLMELSLAVGEDPAEGVLNSSGKMKGIE